MSKLDSDPSDSGDPEFLARAVEVTIRIGIIALVVGWCFTITRPFIAPAVWGVIIATAVYPGFRWLERRLGGRPRLVASLLVGLGLCLLVIPTLLFAGSLVESGQWLASGLLSGTIEIPPPPSGVASWPIVGEPLEKIWTLANTNLEAALRELGPLLTRFGGSLLSAGAGVGLGFLQFFVSIVIAGALLAGGSSGADAAQAIAVRLAGTRGAEFADLAGATVKSVATGIVGVSLIQSSLIGIGLVAMGIPHAALWTTLCLMLAVVQLPPFLVVLPLIVWEFSVESTGRAIVFTIWMCIAGFSDNVLKPLLLSRGVDVPMIVIFIGSIGGFMSMGFIGLFIGAVILALGYELFRAWLGHPEAVR